MGLASLAHFVLEDAPTFVAGSLVATSRLLLGGRLAIDLLLLGTALARSLLGCSRSITLFFLCLCGSRLPTTGLLWSSWYGAFGSRAHQLELDLDLGPGVGSRARVAHIGVASEFFVVNLYDMSDLNLSSKTITDVYLWGSRLERLHSPAQKLKLALGELGRRAIGRSGLVTVRHVDVDVEYMEGFGRYRMDAGEMQKRCR